MIRKTLFQDLTEILFGAPWRWPIIIGQIKMGNPMVKSGFKNLFPCFKMVYITKVVP